MTLMSDSPVVARPETGAGSRARPRRGDPGQGERVVGQAGLVRGGSLRAGSFPGGSFRGESFLGERGRDQLDRGQLDRGQLGRGQLGQGELGRGELGRGELGRSQLGRGELGRLVAGIAAQPGRWQDLVRYDPAQRWYYRMELTDEYEVWLLSWKPGQGTGFHDHGGSVGAFAVALGELQEQTVRGRRDLAVRPVAVGGVRSFGARYVHNVLNNSAGPAVSVHAYSPPLPQMRRYELTPGGLRHTGTEPAEANP